MIIRHRALQLLCAASLIAASPTLLAAQGYYRWHDDAGVEHFTQQPPAGRKSEFIATSTGKSTAVEAGETAASTEAKTAAKDTKKPVTGSIQAVPDKDPEKCQQAQDAQATLNSHARIREKVGEEYRYLTPEEIADQKKLAQESVDVYCEPAAQ